MPERVQLSRKKGWRMPANTVSVARPTQWGNPWRVGTTVPVDMDEDERYRGSAAVVTPEIAVALYRSALLAPPVTPVGPKHLLVITGLASNVCVETARIELARKNLACWCDLSSPCHADVLLEIANA